jgi:glycosyltransferase involved in cell wall biosynthesis
MNKSIIGIDNIAPGLSSSANAHGGMRSYLRDLCLYLPKVLPDRKFVLFTPSWNRLVEEGEQPENLETVILDHVPKSRVLRVGYEQIVLPGLITAHNIDIWIGTVNVIPLAAKCSRIVILQSHQYLTNPTAYPFARRAYLTLCARESLRKADRIVVLSKDSAHVIRQRWSWINDSKVRVVYNRIPTDVTTVDDEPEYQKCRFLLAARPPFILSVSAFYGYKNIERLIRAFARISAHIPHDLVIVGKETTEISNNDLQRLAESLGVAGRVRIEGRLIKPHLQAYYSRASLVAIPSLSETFGLPIVEAMWFGVPVVTSQGGTTEEIAGDAGILVDPVSVDSIATGLLQGLQDSILRERLIAAGGCRRHLFTADSMISNFASLIRELGQTHGEDRRAVLDSRLETSEGETSPIGTGTAFRRGTAWHGPHLFGAR